MFASLPMYLHAQNQSAYSAFWSLIKEQLQSFQMAAPDELSHQADIDFWQQPTLVLSQTCGMPYRLFLHDCVQLVGTPDFALEDCPPGYYYSVMVVHKDDARTDIVDYHRASLAVNAKISQSGFAAPQNLAKKHGFQFSNIVLSEAHVKSAEMVANKTAEIAAIDAVTWRYVQQCEIAKQLKVIAQTEPSPGLPYICGTEINPLQVRDAVEKALSLLPTNYRQALGIKQIISIAKEDYLAVENPE